MSRVHLTDAQWAFIEPLLPPPARTGRPRADDRRTVERSFAWLGNYRRLLIRWERLFAVYHGFFALALARICLNRLI
jgi:transposase